MKAKIFTISLLVGLIITVAAASYSQRVQEGIAQNVVRLHVLANSDAAGDQELKLLVRDRLLSEGRALFANTSSPGQTKEIISENIGFLTQTAKDEIEKNGYSYDVNIELGRYDFPMKRYESYSFPAGEYEALRVEIGKAEGENWWCVMFPPLCFVDAAVDSEKTEETLRQTFTDEEIALITNEDGVDIRFKVVDLFQSSMQTIKTAFKK